MMSRLIFAAGLAVWFAASAQAMDTHPDCKAMKDKVGCTCALNNGGAIVRHTYQYSWVSRPQGTHRAGPNEAFIQCMKRNGRG